VIDTTAKNKAKGRSIIFIGNHSEDGNLEYSEKKNFILTIQIIKIGI